MIIYIQINISDIRYIRYTQIYIYIYIYISDQNNWGGGGETEQKIKFGGRAKFQGGL